MTINGAKSSVCASCGGPKTKGGGHGLCKRCYEGAGSGNKCAKCGALISRRAEHCRKCALSGKPKTKEQIEKHISAVMRAGWSRYHEHCLDCGTTTKKHCAKGLCRGCYFAKYRQKCANAKEVVPKSVPAYRTYEWLHEHYEVQGLTIKQCADIAGVEIYVIRKWIHRNGINTNPGLRLRKIKRSAEWRKNMAKRMTGVGNHQFGKTRDRCHNWKGGVSNEPYPIEFDNVLKRRIRANYNYRCAVCGIQAKLLHIHHIDYRKDNINDDNLIPLCPPCHSRTNSNRDYWTGYLKSLIQERSNGASQS